MEQYVKNDARISAIKVKDRSVSHRTIVEK